ncbi:MAG: flagellin, partial [Pirellulales bacterium]
PGDDVSIAVTAAATKRTVAIVGQDGVSGNSVSLNDLSTNATRTTTTLTGNDFAIGNGASFNDLTTNSTRRVTTLTGNDFAIGTGGSLNDLTTASTRRVTTLTSNDFVIGAGGSLNDLSTNSTRASRAVAFATSGGADFQDLAGAGADTITFSVTGDLGTAAGITVNVAAAKADINVVINAINAQSANTGVIADNNAGDIRLRSTTVGAAATANITATAATQAGDVAAFNATVAGLVAGTTGAATATTFSITGDLGSANVVLANNDTLINTSTVNLDAFVAQINGVSSSTGVIASRNGSNIELRSSFVGTGALASISTAGADAAVIANAGTQASVAGTTGAATATTFTVTGDLGSANVVLANNDTLINHTSANLDAFVAQVNGVSAQTGVVASRSGNNVLLTSSFVGTGALSSITAAGANAALVAAGGTQASVAGTTGAATAVTFTVTGNKGATTVNLANTDTLINHTSANLDAFVAQINGVTGTTGVTAARSGNNIVLTSGNIGSGGLAGLTAAGANAALVAAGGTQAAVAGTNGTSNSTTLEVIGDQGRSVITVLNDAVINDSTALVNAINAVTGTTGVTASTTGTAGANVTLTSNKYGSAAVASLNAIAATNSADITTFNAAGTQSSTAGTNAVGTVTTNKGSAAFAAVGEVISYSDSFINLSASTDPTLGNLTANFDVTGGALFQIGPNVNYANQINVNITGLDLATLGRNFSTTGSKGISALKTGGTDQLSSSDLGTAELLVSQAISQVATLRGQLGSLQKNVLESNIASQQNTLEQVTSALSTIRDADFAAETANLTRSQILVQAGTSVLSIANSSPRDVLALLRQ